MAEHLLHNPGALQALTVLSRRSREAETEAELRFLLVNETHTLCPYRQAVLWQPGKEPVVSGVAAAEANAPYTLWLKQVFACLNKQTYQQPQRITPDQLPETLNAEWGQWLPDFALFIPLSTGGLLLVREHYWHDSDLSNLSEWLSIWQQSYQLHSSHQHGWLQSGTATLRRPLQWFRSVRFWVAALVIASLFLPVRLSVLAPGEIIPFEPKVVRAPLDGVIADIVVSPYQSVDLNTALFVYDQTEINNRLQITTDALRVAKTEYRQKAQQALFDTRLKADLALLQARITERQQELEYLQSLKLRGKVNAERQGIALFQDPSHWEGRPVITGEKIMVIATPDQIEIEAWLAPEDVIELSPGSEALLYLNARPLEPVRASLNYVAHAASLRPEGHYAYRVRASLSGQQDLPQLGLKGTLKLYGAPVSLGYWVIRRPLASLRSWLGW
ncbi:MAG: hypothetical protein AseanaTS_21470 [Candidatus Pelagadaptatus aseana]|uniref:HlyD family efflux transporter periplasmic adaptor subunit n=1 Tax=Candidatus Pelagadaptatus aseana TaxID=3120508 RepID=UPI0039B1EAF4